MSGKILTSGTAAKLCGVSPRTFSKWFDSGGLKGYCIPGSSDRRTWPYELARFLKQEGAGIPAELRELIPRDVLLVGFREKDKPQLLIDKLTEAKFRVHRVYSCFGAGGILELHSPCIHFVDMELGNSEEFARHVREDKVNTEVLIFAILGEETQLNERSLFNETFRKPFDAELLMERAQALIREQLGL